MSPDHALETVGDSGQLAVEPLQPRQSLDFSNLPVYLTLIEAAEYLRCTPEACWCWVKSNHIPRLHRGSRLLFRRDDLDRGVEGHDFLAEAAASYTANDGPAPRRATARGGVNGRVRKPNDKGHFPDSQIHGSDVSDGRRSRR